MLNLPKLDKASLRAEFSKNSDEYYKVKLFDEKGFSRHKCKICGMLFWSIRDRDTCDDSSHTEYSFFKKNPKSIGYVEFWNKFADFFKKNGHTVVPRYPVVSRWRQDLYFTIASIQDFQRIENGAMSFEYPATKLLVPQLCLRFSDIENVGITGRHFTGFMMAGQHAFNYPKEGYWRDRTIELNYSFLVDVLGVEKEDLVYNEDAWAMGDFSEFGPCLESFANGSELVNSVFTQFESINGKIRELDSKVVDVGWGMERLLWFYTGFDTAFEAVFYDIIKKTEKRMSFEFDSSLFKKFAIHASELDITESGGKKKEDELLKRIGISNQDYEKKIKPTQAFYAILDHTRTLLFAISDGALPSNVGGGYNLRVLLRRALSFINEYQLNISIQEIAELQAKELKGLYPEFSENLDLFQRVTEIEAERFEKSKQNANRVIESVLAKNKKIDAKELRTLYESNGITPELLEAMAAKKNVKLQMPESNYEDIIKGDFAAKEHKKKLDIDVQGLPKTEQLYYEMKEESRSKVLAVKGSYVVLDKTPFYPEGGGQEADHGTINGMIVNDVQKVGDVIVHIMDGDAESRIKKRESVECKVDAERRERLMVHHTSTHLMSAAARSVLGKHAWQEGTRKSFDKAHIDIAHYERLNNDDERRLEDFVNNALERGIKVTVKQMDRSEAEGKYGFAIYQGHGVPSKTIRIVLIEDRNGNFIDAEACGGLHVVGKEKSISIIRILKTERISDGVDRIEFAAGKAALDRMRQLQEELDRSKKESAEALAKARQDAQKSEEELIGILAGAINSKGKSIEGDYDLQKNVMRKLAFAIANSNKDKIVELRNKGGDIVCVRGSDLKKDSALNHLKEKYKDSFKGGGNEEIAEGRITK